MESYALTAPEVRVLGALVEKDITTPDYYPLTLHALTAACNQTSNREPVVAFDEATVVRALDGLRAKKLAVMISAADSRVPKYAHKLNDVFGLPRPEVAALCVLLLRGPQTIGEIRNRTGRMHEFETLEEVEQVLQALATHEPVALATKLPRQAGCKESRFAHLLAGEIAVEAVEAAPRPEAATLAVRREDERLAKLEAETAALRGELADLRREFAAFRKQFE